MREKRAALGLLALGVVGWAASLYLLVEHIRARIELSLGGACDINETFNCTVAALSPYSQIPGGYPTAALGVAYYFGF
ncbi:MAG: vitamin K epoxide reductase family protein, partial [Clostridia bacterium]|nr:vitamin K epoxide reductase family protein [Deltaproteobacteria bacterium]